MSDAVDAAKNKIREDIKKQRSTLSGTLVTELSREISDKLFHMDFYNNASTIFLYLSLLREVQTEFIIKNCFENAKNVFVPHFSGKDNEMRVVRLTSTSKIEIGPFGIRMPENSIEIEDFQDIDLILVPGLAFDVCGNRIGFGKGYYDNFLSKISNKKVKAGLCFDFQLFKKIPATTKDIPLDYILTERQTVETKVYRS